MRKVIIQKKFFVYPRSFLWLFFPSHRGCRIISCYASPAKKIFFFFEIPWIVSKSFVRPHPSLTLAFTTSMNAWLAFISSENLKILNLRLFLGELWNCFNNFHIAILNIVFFLVAILWILKEFPWNMDFLIDNGSERCSKNRFCQC